MVQPIVKQKMHRFAFTASILTHALCNWSNEKEETASDGEEWVSKEILIQQLEQMFQNLECYIINYAFRPECETKRASRPNPRK
jgi:hypothetical protein